MTKQALEIAVDEHRVARGFLRIGEMMERFAGTNTILDPWSTLISADVELGDGNILYPGITMQAVNDGRIKVGDDNTFYSGCYLLADQGSIQAGHANSFGDGGVIVKANRAGAAVRIGDRGRFSGGPQILGGTLLGDGTQILGAITVQQCHLAGGGDYSSPVPDDRGAVLKGSGIARGLRLETGDVIETYGQFTQGSVVRQSTFHPPSAR